MTASRDDVLYVTLSGLPPETPIPLTAIDRHSGRYDDFGPGMYCSPEGKESAKRARNELWAVRHQTRDELPGPTWFYCREHLPTREWVAGEDGRAVRATEVACQDCFLVVPRGTICEQTGQVH